MAEQVCKLSADAWKQIKIFRAKQLILTNVP